MFLCGAVPACSTRCYQLLPTPVPFPSLEGYGRSTARGGWARFGATVFGFQDKLPGSVVILIPYLSSPLPPTFAAEATVTSTATASRGDFKLMRPK